MSNPCNDRGAWSGVSIDCSTSKCLLPSSDTGQHIVEIHNRRTGPIYDIEVAAVARGGLVVIGGIAAPTKYVATRTLVSNAAPANRYSVIANITHAHPNNADEIITTVEFYDDTQQTPTGFAGPKESYPLAYQITLDL